MYCKTIILSNSKNINNSPKGILTLSNDNLTTQGKIRLYNSPILPTNTKIGLYIGENVHICTLIKKPQHYEFALDKQVDLNQSVYCAIIDNSKGDKEVLLEGGSFNGFYFSDSPIDAVLEAKDEELEKTIDTAMAEAEKCEQCNACANCVYKKYFYESKSTKPIPSPDVNDENLISNDEVENIDQSSDLANQCVEDKSDSSTTRESLNNNDLPIEQNEIIDEFQNQEDTNIENIQNDKNQEEIIEKTPSSTNKNEPTSIQDITRDIKSNEEKDTPNNENSEQEAFLNDIMYQLDEMFKIYPADDILNSIIPESRFIRVDNIEQSYVLGIIYEDKMMKYIAYGVPAKYNSLPPADLGKNYQWLPLNPEDVMSDGYFMIYQNALNGKIVDLIIE